MVVIFAVADATLQSIILRSIVQALRKTAAADIGRI